MQRTPTPNGMMQDTNPVRYQDEQETALIMEILENQFLENRHNWYLAKDN